MAKKKSILQDKPVIIENVIKSKPIETGFMIIINPSITLDKTLIYDQKINNELTEVRQVLAPQEFIKNVPVNRIKFIKNLNEFTVRKQK